MKATIVKEDGDHKRPMSNSTPNIPDRLSEFLMRYEGGEVVLTPIKRGFERRNLTKLRVTIRLQFDPTSKTLKVVEALGTLLSKHGEETQELESFEAPDVDNLFEEVINWAKRYLYAVPRIQ
jgi:hypothetical protein